MTIDRQRDIIAGAYWRIPPATGCTRVIAYCGVVAPEAASAHHAILAAHPGAGLLAITSPGRVHADWLRHGRESHIARLLAPLASDARIVSVLDGHPAALSWLGAVRGSDLRALGVSRFGQSADIQDLFAQYGIDAAAISAAAA